jgi:sphingomyelin phosphodiesterase 2
MGRTSIENDAVGIDVPLLGATTPPTNAHQELNRPTTLTSSTTNSLPTDYPTTVRVFSYNCWGLKYIAKYRNTRLIEIGRQIAALDPKPDIVGLQECWTQQDYLAIRELTNHFLPYGKYYWSGIWGGGLAILSRWPIEASNMVKYPLNGRPTAFFRGDWFVGKGVACAKLRIGPGRKDFAEVFCTHVCREDVSAGE